MNPRTYGISGILKLVALILLFPTIAVAGNESGHGGGSVVCFDSPAVLERIVERGLYLNDDDIDHHIAFIEAYDLYQARLSHNLAQDSTPIFELNGDEVGGRDGYATYIGRLAARFDRTVPVVSELLRQALDNRKDAIISYIPNGVAQVYDAHPRFILDKDNCTLVTTALQYDEGSQLFINFDRRLLKHPKNSELSRAVLHLHEYVYSIGRAFGHESSEPTRELLSVILPRSVPRTAAQLVKLYDSLKFPRLPYILLGYKDGYKNQAGWFHSTYSDYQRNRDALGIYTARVVFDAIRALFEFTHQTAIRYDSVNDKVKRAMKEYYSDRRSDDTCNHYENARYESCKRIEFNYYFKARARYVTPLARKQWSAIKAKYLNIPEIDDSMRRSLDEWVMASFDMNEADEKALDSPNGWGGPRYLVGGTIEPVLDFIVGTTWQASQYVLAHYFKDFGGNGPAAETRQ